MEIFKTIIAQFPGFMFGIVATLFVTIGSGYIKEYFNGRARKAKHKLNVAIEVHKVCNEASTESFLKAPRNNEHINSVLTDVEGVDEKMGEVMTEFVSSWRSLVSMPNLPHSRKDSVYMKEQLDRAEDRRKTLTKWASKIRAGK